MKKNVGENVKYNECLLIIALLDDNIEKKIVLIEYFKYHFDKTAIIIFRFSRFKFIIFFIHIIIYDRYNLY